MNKLLSLITVALVAFTVSAQCEADHDFGTISWGVYPDAAQGESFLPGVVTHDYYDVMHILVPSTAQDFDAALPPAVLDSMVLTGVTLFDVTTELQYNPEDLGLEYVCNNNGDLPNPCALLGAQQYCMSIQGVPTIPGTFQLSLEVMGHFSLAGQSMSQPWTFDNFALTVHCDIIDDMVVTDGNSTTEELGTIDITVAEGVVETSFVWYNSTGDVVGTNEDLVAEPGTYSLYMTGDGCSSLFDFVIGDAAVDCLLDAEYEITNTDEGAYQGMIDLSISGANGNVYCVWSDEEGIIVSTSEDLENADVGVYSVTITDEQGCIFELENLVITLGVEDLMLNVVWDMMPNPASDIVTISSTSLGVKAIQIRDVQGRTIYNSNFVGQEKINVSEWDRGFYFVTVSDQTSQSTRRLVINK